MKRREFIAFFGAAVASGPFAARAQQRATPVVGFLNAASAQAYSRMLSAFLKGLNEEGYVENQNVRIEYRWAQGDVGQLPAMMADLVGREVAVIAATGTPAALAAKEATTPIPIVFETGNDPVQLGLVPSLNRPGGNLTGIAQLAIEVAPKRLELLHEMIPSAKNFAVLVDSTDRMVSENTIRGAQGSAQFCHSTLHIRGHVGSDSALFFYGRLLARAVHARSVLTQPRPNAGRCTSELFCTARGFQGRPENLLSGERTSGIQSLLTL